MNESNGKQSSNREMKSSVFTTYFSDPENAAQLYSALEVSQAGPEDIEYTTLEGVLFLARKNDMAFTVKKRILVISEHQSTVNNNMPLRDIIYYGRTMERLLGTVDIYRSRVIPIPTPEFFVFYNGNHNYPSEKILKLSDSYIEKTNTPMLELLVKVININPPAGHAILERCKPLYEYSWFIQKGKEHTQTIMQSELRNCERSVKQIPFDTFSWQTVRKSKMQIFRPLADRLRIVLSKTQLRKSPLEKSGEVFCRL